MKYSKLVILLAFLLCSCAGVPTEEPDKPAATNEGQKTETDETTDTAVTSTTTVSDENGDITKFRNQRQLEMQKMMQEKMMRGSTQTNRPINIGPP
ncbi:MAG: hypothetical protein HZA78_08555 [Candidatus Schekmanbacteria bacterium]|nr:hypothetical protein [Candidatus Schekmanbacteria bacterium]